MGLKVFFSIFLYWFFIKSGFSPVILYVFFWLLVVIPKFSINYTFLHIILILYSLIGYYFGVDYSAEILISILFLTLPKIKISKQDINFSWLIVALIGVLEFTGFISSDILQISDQEYDYFKIQSLLGNPYMNGVFTFFVLAKNIKNKNWIYVLLALAFSFLLGNRAVIVVCLLYTVFSLYNYLSLKSFSVFILFLYYIINFGISSSDDVSWQEFDRPIDRFFTIQDQIDNESATIFLTPRFIDSEEFSLINIKVIPNSHWILDFSVTDVMISYVAYSYGLLFVLLYLYLLYKFIKQRNYDSKHFLIFCFLLLSISDPGIFHPLLIYLFILIL